MEVTPQRTQKWVDWAFLDPTSKKAFPSRASCGANDKFRSVSNYGMVEWEDGFIKDGHWL